MYMYIYIYIYIRICICQNLVLSNPMVYDHVHINIVILAFWEIPQSETNPHELVWDIRHDLRQSNMAGWEPLSKEIALPNFRVADKCPWLGWSS